MLGNDVLGIIFSKLEFKEKLRVRAVCQKFRKLCEIKIIPNELQNKITDEVLDCFPHLEYLKAYAVTDNAVMKLKNLKGLSISEKSPLTNNCFINGNFEKLQLLNIPLSNNHITDDCLQYCPNIEILLVRNNCGFTSEKSLGYLKKLKTFEIGSNNKYTDTVFNYITQIEYLTMTSAVNHKGPNVYLMNLNTLILSCAYYFSGKLFKYMPNLKRLELSYIGELVSTITDDDFVYITKLESLTLISSHFTNKCLSYVPNLKHLEIEEIDGITNDGLRQVPKLVSLNVKHTNAITEEALQFLPNIKKYSFTPKEIFDIPSVEFYYNYN